jgi:hypothetical protein
MEIVVNTNRKTVTLIQFVTFFKLSMLNITFGADGAGATSHYGSGCSSGSATLVYGHGLFITTSVTIVADLDPDLFGRIRMSVTSPQSLNPKFANLRGEVPPFFSV